MVRVMNVDDGAIFLGQAGQNECHFLHGSVLWDRNLP